MGIGFSSRVSRGHNIQFVQYKKPLPLWNIPIKHGSNMCVCVCVWIRWSKWNVCFKVDSAKALYTPSSSVQLILSFSSPLPSHPFFPDLPLYPSYCCLFLFTLRAERRRFAALIVWVYVLNRRDMERLCVFVYKVTGLIFKDESCYTLGG